MNLALTMGIVMIGWVMFRAATVTDAFIIYAGMAGANGWALSSSFAWQIQPVEIAMLACGVLFSLCGRHLGTLARQTSEVLRVTSSFALLGLACVALLSQSHSPFLFFQF